MAENADIRFHVAQAPSAPLYLHARMANRHGLIAGATGTGKTVSLQVLAEAFSAKGIPVFMADVKGDLSGIGKAGAMNKIIAARTEEFGLKDFNFQSFPVCFYDVFGKEGHPLRTTVSDMGPLLLSRLLGLNDTQSGTLSLVFRIADDKGWLLLDMKDLRAMLDYAGKNARQFTTSYGIISSATIGAIQRGLLALEDQGGSVFFGEPAFDIFDLLQTSEGKGLVSVLSAGRLMQSPMLYSTMMLWLLSELYENFPEAGDLPKPKLVFFFDEAHLLFDHAPKVLTDKIEQIARLIRSKGVGVYFISQSPSDIPDAVLGQLGNRIQHALRAYTPRDQKAVKVAAQTFRTNPKLDTERVIGELGVGEALVSFLDEAGRPSMVERAKILPPHSQIGPLSAEERMAAVRSSRLYGKYEQSYDRVSAYEKLQEAADAEASGGSTPSGMRLPPRPPLSPSGSSSPGQAVKRGSSGIGEAVFKTVLNTLGSRQGQRLIRGIFGSLIKK